jgi:hypothetical protein
MTWPPFLIPSSPAVACMAYAVRTVDASGAAPTGMHPMSVAGPTDSITMLFLSPKWLRAAVPLGKWTALLPVQCLLVCEITKSAAKCNTSALVGTKGAPCAANQAGARDAASALRHSLVVRVFWLLLAVKHHEVIVVNGRGGRGCRGGGGGGGPRPLGRRCGEGRRLVKEEGPVLDTHGERSACLCGTAHTGGSRADRPPPNAVGLKKAGIGSGPLAAGVGPNP